MDREILLECMNGLVRDLPRLQTIDDYLIGEHPDPYMPKSADEEYKLLAKRCVTNLMPSVVKIPIQAMYVDGVRSGRTTESDEGTADTSNRDTTAAAHWEHWQRSHLDMLQTPIHRAAVAFGLAFTITELRNDGMSITRGLSPLRTFAYYEYPEADMDPLGAFTVVRDPVPGEKGSPGFGYFWDETYRYDVRFGKLGDDETITVSQPVKHGLKGLCPVTRFSPQVDLEGRCMGVIEPMMRLQDRVNQTVFDLLMAQSGGSWQTRTATGMAPPLVTEPVEVEDEDGTTRIIQRPKLDANGNYIPRPMKLNLSDFLYAEDPDTKFGYLPGTPLGGYIESLDQALRHFTTIGQIPPHYMLGEVANLSSDAMQAAETTLFRWVTQLRTSIAESWERDFRLAAELNGDMAAADDYAAEVLWRDMDAQSMSRVADALGKLKESLEIPAQGLWPRVPGVTPQEIEEWTEMAANQPSAQLAGSMSSAQRFFDTAAPGAPGVEGGASSSEWQRPAWSA